jgi:hypothetical protein
MAHQGWIGVDLDGTLALYTGWKGPTHIGEPVPAMAERVRRWLAQGVDVRIFTARSNPTNPDAPAAVPAVRAWCIEHFGRELPITWEKDMEMVCLYDDRAKQVITNTGILVESLVKGYEEPTD